MTMKTAQLTMDNNHYQYQSGFLSESAWKAYEAELKELLLIPYYRYIWEDTKYQYRDEFQSLVSELIRQNEAGM